jgi:hypothetical protein
MALTQVSTDGIKNGTITGTDLATNVDLVDNQKLRLGTGNDLQIYHNGTESLIVNTNDLFLLGDPIQLRRPNGDKYVQCIASNAVKLFFDGNEKFETSSAGVSVTGNISATGHFRPTVDDNSDLGSSILRFRNQYISASGSIDFLDNGKIKMGNSDDLQIYHDGTDSHIQNTNNSGELKIRAHQTDIKNADNNETQAIFHENGAVELYYDNSKKFETTSIGATVTGALHATTTNVTTQMFMPDQGQIRLGNSDDLKLYHDGHSIIQNTNSSAAFLICSHATHMVNAALTENIAKFKENAEVELYYDNSLKFTTTTNGVSLFGDLRFNNGTWTGESLTGKIQTHSGHMYLQNASTSGFWIFRLPNGTESANINSSGSYTGSDERRKKDITTITGAVDTIKQLIGRSFTWKEEEIKSFGIIAQEVEPVLPDLVTTQTVIEGDSNTDPYKMVNYAALTGHFIEAIKELSTKIDVLETEVAALKAS